MKTRITSLLLTAVLVLSSMAAAIPAAADEIGSVVKPVEIGIDLMEKASTDAAVVNVEDGNGYLHIYDRYNSYNNPHPSTGAPRPGHNLVTAIGWQPALNETWKGKTVNYISFKARIANNWATQAEAQATDSSFPADATTMYYRMYAGGNFLTFDFFKLKLPQWNSDSYVDYVNSENNYAGNDGKKNQTKSIAPPQFMDTNELWAYRWSLPENPVASYQYKAYSDGIAVALTNEWTNFTFAFVPRQPDYTVGRKINGAVQQYWIYFTSESGAYRNIPFDIDDFEIYYYDGSTKVSVVSHNFNDIENPSHVYQESPSDRYGKFFAVNGAAKAGYNKHFKLSNITETDYYEVKVPQTGNTANGTIGYTFPTDTVLDPGEYVFTADARLNFYDGYLDDTVEVNGTYPVKQHWQFIENEDNTADLDIKVNGESIGNCDVKSEWTPVTFTYTVPKGLNVTLESLTADFTDDTYSVNKAFNIKNAKFVKIETFIPDDEFEKSRSDVVFTIEDDAFAITAGAAGSKVEMAYSDSYSEGNQYLRVTGRTNERDGFILDLRGIVDNSEENDYRLRFKVRASNELSNLDLGFDLDGYLPNETMVKLSEGVDTNGKYVVAAPVVFKPGDQYVSYYKHMDKITRAGLYWWEFDNSEWKTVDVAFNDLKTAIKENDEIIGYNRFNVIHFGGSTAACHAVNFDIDEIIVYNNADGFVARKDNFDESVDEIIWKQDFQNEKVGELSEEMSANFVPFKETWLADAFRTEEVALEVAQDAPYYTAEGVKELKYTVPSYAEITLEPGVYTINGSFSYPYFDGNRITTDVGSARQRNYIKENNNKVDVCAILETENDVVRFDDVTVDNSWTDCGFVFKIDESTKIKQITFVFTDASGAETTTVCYRDIYIEGNYPPITGFPNEGVVMMLLQKRKTVAAAAAEKAEAEADLARSDAEVVYPIIDKSFKSVTDGKNSVVKSEYPGSYENGNKYLRISGRYNNRDGLILDLRRAVLDVSDNNYRLSFRIRTSAAVSNLWTNTPKAAPYIQNDGIRLGEGLYNGAYTPASPTVFNKATIESSNFNPSAGCWYINNKEWTTIDVAFTELKNQNVIHIGGGSIGLQASTFDIDDVKVYVPGEAEPVYLEDFQDEKAGALTEALSNFYVPFQNGNVPATYRPSSVEINIEEDSTYYTASGASLIKYTPKADSEIALAAGEYTVHASFSYPYYDGNHISIAETNDSKKQSYLESNANKFDVTCLVETDAGTLTFDSYTVENVWADCEFSFTVEKDTVVKSVAFKLTGSEGAESTTACFREVYIDGILADEEIGAKTEG